MRAPIRFPVLVKGLGALSLLALINSACSVTNRNDPVSAPPGDRSAPGDPNAATMTYPDGWDTIVLAANYAETKIFSNAHWATSRTACGYDAYAAYSLPVWNPLADALNHAVALAPLAQENCFDFPGPYKMEGSAKAVSDAGKERVLFTNRGWQACTTISDPELASRLLSLLNDTVVLADANKENCPFGS